MQLNWLKKDKNIQNVFLDQRPPVKTENDAP
jgi:hypothetical protein